VTTTGHDGGIGWGRDAGRLNMDRYAGVCMLSSLHMYAGGADTGTKEGRMGVERCENEGNERVD
jgi:hypothetical protein